MKKYVIAKNYLCFLALVEMIIYDSCDGTIVTQDDMAERFGITISRNSTISINNVRVSSVLSDYGLHINTRMLNEMFADFGLSLKVAFEKESPYEYNEIDSLSSAYLRNNKYLIYTFGYGYLYNDVKKLDLGHAALFESSKSESTIQIYDPGPLNPGIRVVNRIDMHEAMLKRAGGIFVFNAQ